MSQGPGTEELERLRWQANRLQRRLQETQTRLAQDAREARARRQGLEGELTAMKRSRAWRAVLVLRGLWSRLAGLAARRPEPAGGQMDRRAEQYRAYLAAHALSDLRRSELRARQEGFGKRPLISIVMPVRDPPARFLRDALQSVFEQIYDHWELCLVDDGSTRPETAGVINAINDPRVKTRRRTEGGSIAAATNEAIGMAAGEYVAFMDHDDRLAREALTEVVSLVNDNTGDEPEPELIYSDEDFLRLDGIRTEPHFKPDFSPDLLLSHNYMTHLVVVSRSLIERVGRLRTELDGAQDYDFLLRATEQARRISHIPEVLYHWRMSESSSAMNAAGKPHSIERGRAALEDALRRRGYRDARVDNAGLPHFYRVRYALKSRPGVSIVVPFKDRPELLHCVIGDVLEKSTYENFEIIGVDNASEERATRDAKQDLAGLDKRVKFIDYDAPFNFSAIVNSAAASSTGEHLVLLNNDVRIITEDWLEAMLEHSQRPEAGAVGGKLYYPDGSVQHAGIVVGIDGYAGHAHKGFPRGHQGYFNRLQVVQNVSAVTGAFMMVKTALFKDAGGFDAECFGTACNDVDFCLRLREKGYWNVFTPHAEAWHLESASRGYEDTPEKAARHARERAAFRRRHAAVLEAGDPFYNINLTDTLQDFSLRQTAARSTTSTRCPPVKQ